MSKWISVKDRLPEGDQAYPVGVVLVRIEYEFDESDFAIAQYNPPRPEEIDGDMKFPAQKGYWELMRTVSYPCTVTHWMPIPAIEGIEQTTKGDQNA